MSEPTMPKKGGLDGAPVWWVKEGWVDCPTTKFNFPETCTKFSECGGYAVKYRHLIYPRKIELICPHSIPLTGVYKVPEGWKALYWKHCTFIKALCREECRGYGLLVLKEKNTGELLDVCPMDCFSPDGLVVDISPETIERAIEIEDREDAEKPLIFEFHKDGTPVEKPEEPKEEKQKFKYKFDAWVKCWTPFHECGLDQTGLCDGFICKLSKTDNPLVQSYACSCDLKLEEIEGFITRQMYQASTSLITATQPPKPKIMFFQKQA